MALSLLGAVVYAACKKPGMTEPEKPSVAPTAYMSRTYYVGGVTRHVATYLPADSVRVSTMYFNGRFMLALHSVQPHVGYADGISFYIDSAVLKQPKPMRYTFSPNTVPAWHLIYTLIYFTGGGYDTEEWMGTVTEFGYPAEGELVFTKFDSVNRRLSGNFSLRMPKLTYHLEKRYSVLDTAAASVAITGSFTDVPLR